MDKVVRKSRDVSNLYNGNAAESAEIVRLAAGCGIKGRAIEGDAKTSIGLRLAGEYRGVEGAQK
jgi:hypothetical protein